MFGKNEPKISITNPVSPMTDGMQNRLPEKKMTRKEQQNKQQCYVLVEISKVTLKGFIPPRKVIEDCTIPPGPC